MFQEIVFLQGELFRGIWTTQTSTTTRTQKEWRELAYALSCSSSRTTRTRGNRSGFSVMLTVVCCAIPFPLLLTL